MQLSGGGARFAVRAVSPTRMAQLFLSARGIRATKASAQPSGRGGAQAAPAADLVSWVESAGGSVGGVHVLRDAAGFGLAAAQDCGPGSTLIALPQRCHLSFDEQTDPRLLALINQVPAELWGAKLALQVVAHRLLGAASPFSPYINNLPMGVAGLPMFWDGATLGMLQYPPVTEQVKKRCRWLLHFTQQALAPIRGSEADPFGGAEVDANALGWALAVVTSRAFRTRGPGQPAAMLPLIDLANHSFQPNAKIAPGPGGSMLMVATRQLRAGEPVHISYGPLQNDFLLLDYGFCMGGNPHETVQLRFDRGLIEAAKAVTGVGGTGGPAGDEELPQLAAWQNKALASLQLAGPEANTEVSIRRQAAGEAAAAEGPVDPRLLASVRVLCAPSEAALGGGGAEALGRWSKPMAAPAAELAALRTLTGLVAIALSQFQGSLEDDAALLAGTAPASAAGDNQQQEQQQQQGQRLTEDQQLAVRFRMDKKALLLDALGAIGARIKELQGSSGDGGGKAGGKAGGGGSSSGSGGGKKAGGKAGGGKKGSPPKAKTNMGFGS